MDQDEHKWVEEATTLCERAKQKGISLLLIRRQSLNDHADVYVTNASPEILTQLMMDTVDDEDDED